MECSGALRQHADQGESARLAAPRLEDDGLAFGETEQGGADRSHYGDATFVNVLAAGIDQRGGSRLARAFILEDEARLHGDDSRSNVLGRDDPRPLQLIHQIVADSRGHLGRFDQVTAASRQLDLRSWRTHIRGMNVKLQHSQHRGGRLHAGL